MHSHYDYNHQKDDPKYAEEYELVLADPAHHGLDQLTTFAEIVSHSA